MNKILIGMIILVIGAIALLNFSSSMTTVNISGTSYALIISPECFGKVFEEYLLLSDNWKTENIIMLYNDNATKATITQAINTLSNKVTSIDTVLIIVTAHGGKGYSGPEGNWSGNFFVRQENYPDYNAPFSWSEFGTKLNNISSKHMGIIIVTCYSGDSIPYLKGEGRVILTNANADEVADGTNNYPYGLLFADYTVGDKKGTTSMEEMYNYIIHEGITFSHPQIQDDYPGELNIFSPKEKIDQIGEYTRKSGKFGLIYNNNGLEGQVAQSFKPSQNTLTKVGLILSYPQAPIIISIRKELSGPDLTSKVLQPSEINEGCTIKYTIVDFPDIIVTPESTYYIVCKNYGTGYPTTICETNNSYSRGEVYGWGDQKGTGSPSTQSWTVEKDFDFLFYTIGTGGTEGGVEIEKPEQTIKDNYIKVYKTSQVAQSFIPASSILTKVELCIGRMGKPTDVVVSIWSSLDDSTLTGTDLTKVSKLTSLVPTSAGWITFDFPDISVTPGNTYYIVVKTTGGTSSNYYNLGYSMSNKYNSGYLKWSPNGYWRNYISDLCFKIS